MEKKKYTFEELCMMKPAELEEVFKKGITPDFKKLAGWEFRGYNVTPVAKLLGIQKFKKGFYYKNEQPFGYNIPVVQNRFWADWECLPDNQEPKRFGFYSVKKVNPSEKENKEPHALILNYGDGENSLFDGKFLRDYLVQVDPDNPDLYLGKAYIALGPMRVFSNFFVLERHRESWVK